MNANTIRTLEFDKILEMAAAFAVTAPGKYALQSIRPLKDIGDIRRQITLVSECRGLLSEGQPFGIEHFEELSSLFQKVRPADAVIDPLEIRSFIPLFNSAGNLRLLGKNPLCPNLGAIVSHLTPFPDIRKSIDRALGSEGEIRDNASPELSGIRKSMKSCENKIKKILDGMLKQKDLMPYLQDFYLAVRNNRLVIPVKREFKGNVPGVVHDISNTGETLYVEPYPVQHLGNELESYRAEEKLEEYRILRSLCNLLRSRLHEIENNYRIVTRVDALQALGGFSRQMDMSPPEINEGAHLKILRGRHPLLWKTLSRENRLVNLVPLDLELGKDHSCMVITGSNAGGKTVALKTTGALSLMALSGMHIPAGSGTTIPMLEKILVDIGDEQSIEQNLSTFSAHITRISEIIRQSNPHTLVLIDELGTGTDPEQGGALSCAILRRLKQQGALAAASTHLGMLKVFAHSEPGVVNSAMEMEKADVNGVSTYRPTYKLVTGEPGASHTFEIAESLGLHGDIIRVARDFIKDGGVRIESLISDLRQKNAALDNMLKDAERLKQESGHLNSHLNERLTHLKIMEKEITANALKQAEEVVRRTKREARAVIETLKKSPAPEPGKVVKELDKKLDEIAVIRQQHSPEKKHPLIEIKEGQCVFVNPLKAHGRVLSVNKKSQRCRVAVDGKDIEVPFAALFKPDAGFIEHQTPSGEKEVSQYGRSEKTEDIGEELNVVGQRVDPALSLIERRLNDASIAGLKQVKIIHGIGAGILSRAIRDYLKDHPLVESFRKGDEDEGGEAVTIAAL